MLPNSYALRRGPCGVQSQEDYVLSFEMAAAPEFAATEMPMTTGNPKAMSEQLLDRILVTLDEDKAEDIVSIDLRGKTAVADYMVICSGRSSRQVTALAEKMVARLKEEFGVFAKLEGKDQGDWVLIDTGDVVVHVFRPEVREFYQLEKMWLPIGQGKTEV